MSRKAITKLGIIGLILGLYVGFDAVQTNIKQALFIMENLDVGLLTGYVESFDIPIVISILLMILQSIVFYLSEAILIVVNAELFGVAGGFFVSWTGRVIGASLCFAIARLYGRNIAEKLIYKVGLGETDKLFERYGKNIVLISRLMPIVPFDIVSYISGITSISFKSFIWATAIGQIPLVFIYSYFGETFSGDIKLIALNVVAVLASSVAILLSRYSLGRNKSKVRKGDEEIA